MQENAISEELLAILVCPETKQPVTLATDTLISALNTRIASGTIKTTSGQPATITLTAGLIREDSQILYPIIDGIPIMLIEEGLVLDNLNK